MPVLWLPFDLACALAAVTARRLRHGRARPSWSWRYEVAVELLRRFSLRAHAWPIVKRRRAWDMAGLPSPRVRLRVARAPLHLGEVPVVRFQPRGAAPGLVILYLHGGSYCFGSMRTHGDLLGRLALAAQAPVIGVTYRLAPEHPLPAALDDAVAAYRALLAHGVPASEIVLAGDSAGGGLCASVLVALRNAGEALPAGAVLVCPWVDLGARDGSVVANTPFDWGHEHQIPDWAALYLAGADPRDPRASPAFADLRGLPPMLVQFGGAEMLRDQIAAFVQRAREAGVRVEGREWPDMVHNWHMFAAVHPGSREAIAEAAAFCRRVARPGA